ncbi:MAG TPA: hypothetical protein VFJ57_03960 [Solirubrobacterales bacterium]|nr:hypothetical protein [Solirubrobacterales bacterium]
MIVDQFGRLLARRAHEHDEQHPIALAPAEAAKDTLGVAVSGYAAAPRTETVLFNLLAGFLGSFATVRLSTLGIRERRGPFRNLHVRGYHIHHFVPGILIAFGSGIAAVVTDDDELEQRLAIPLGVGIGLTFDEAALLLDLRDVYWTREGLLSVQVSLGATAILSIAILTQRILRRGERRQEEQGLIPPAGDHLSAGTGALA